MDRLTDLDFTNYSTRYVFIDKTIVFLQGIKDLERINDELVAARALEESTNKSNSNSTATNKAGSTTTSTGSSNSVAVFTNVAVVTGFAVFALLVRSIILGLYEEGAAQL